MIPRTYRSLLTTYPRAWRREHGEVVLGTLLDVHVARGRTRPTAAEHLQFAADGLRLRMVQRLRRAPVRRFVDTAVLAGFRTFDQENGLVPPPRMVSEIDQIRANSPVDRDSDVDRVTAISYSAMGMIR